MSPRDKPRRAALGSAAFFVAGPCVVAGVVPYALTRWRPKPVPGGAATRALGAALLAAGTAVVATSFVRFVREGLGTPMPAAPPTELVVGGIYRHVRNPMYVALGAIVAGQALLLGQRRLLGYLALMSLPVQVTVRLYEEPQLSERFGASYARYCANVPRWLPRLTPWRPDQAPE